MTAGIAIRNSGSLNIQLDHTKKSFSITQKISVTFPDNGPGGSGYVDVSINAVAPVAAVYSPNGFSSTTVIISNGNNSWTVRVVGTKGITSDLLIMDISPIASITSRGRIRNPSTGEIVFDFGAFYPSILGQGKYQVSNSSQSTILLSGLSAGKYAVVTTQPGSYMIPVNPPPNGNFQYTGAFRSDSTGASAISISTSLWAQNITLASQTDQGWMVIDVTSYYPA